MIRVGGNGAGLSLRKRTGGGDGTGNGSEGGGGGYSGLFIGSSTPDYTQANAILMAGGGGGGASDPATGGVGGGSEGDSSNADRNNRGGRGGTQTAGGAGGSAPGEGGVTGEPGKALQGGNGPAGGGGGGYFGGGGGFGNNVVGADGGGGGGSGFMHSTLITDGVLTQGEGTVEEGVNGSFRIEIASTEKTVTTTVTGATTPNLSITTDDEKLSGVVRCKLTADGVQKSPVFSRSVSYYVVAIRNVLKIEQYKYSDESVIFSEHDLSNGSLSLSADTHEGNDICLYAAEQDINVEIDMYGGKGSDNGSNLGGEGGYSKIRFTMEKDVEYILTGLFSAVNAPFLYRKATLIAVVGEGGDAGTTSGNGGFGGGINLGGQGGGGVRVELVLVFLQQELYHRQDFWIINNS